MDNTPTALFESYEADFTQILEGVKERLESAGTGDQRKAALRRVEADLDEADEMVSQMEIETQGMPQSIRTQFTPRIKTAKTELNRWKATSKEVQQAASRDALLGGGSKAYPAADDPYSDRQRLLAGTQSLTDSTKRLEQSHRVALETEEVGADILRSLRVQREQIEHSREMLGGAEGHVDRASGTLKGMIRTMYKQRFITGAILAVLVLIILFILWRKLF